MKLIFLVLCVAVCANAQTLSSPAAFVVPEEKSKPIAIPKFDKPPTIDGKLDEEVWQTAAVLKDFYQIQPGDNTPLQNQPKFSSASIRSFSTSLNSRLRSQALFGWTPSPGTAFYAGYNDDLNYDSPHPFTTQLVPGFRRNSRTFFIKASYLIRKGF